MAVSTGRFPADLIEKAALALARKQARQVLHAKVGVDEQRRLSGQCKLMGDVRSQKFGAFVRKRRDDERKPRGRAAAALFKFAAGVAYRLGIAAFRLRQDETASARRRVRDIMFEMAGNDVMCGHEKAASTLEPARAGRRSEFQKQCDPDRRRAGQSRRRSR